MIDETEQRGKAVPALVRTKKILDALSTGGKPKGVSDLARMLDLPKSTVHGLCHTLVDLGLMMRVGPNQFAVGPHVLSWANAFEGQSDLTQEFMRIADANDLISKQAINLSILTGREVMYVACRRGTDPLGYYGVIAAFLSVDYEPRIHQIRTPAVYIGGAHDQVGGPPDILKRVSAKVPGATYVPVPDASHIANLQNPEGFNAALGAFLRAQIG